MLPQWIPRNKRWTEEERKRRELEARNSRAMSRLFWIELNKTREKIEEEISEKKLARIRLLD